MRSPIAMKFLADSTIREMRRKEDHESAWRWVGRLAVIIFAGTSLGVALSVMYVIASGHGVAW